MKLPYDYIDKCCDGFIRVKNGTPPKQLKCGYLDENFNEVIPLIYTGIKRFSEGLAAVKTGNWANGKWGFINKKGELVIPCLFDKTFPFSDGYAKVVLNGKWCFIDKEGNEKVELSQYDGSTSFHAGFAAVSLKDDRDDSGSYTIIDKKGNELLPITEGFPPCMRVLKEYSTRKYTRYYKYLHNLITLEEFRALNW